MESIDADRVYVFFGKSGVFAFDLEGRQLWHAKVGSRTSGWGSAASPVLDGDLVIVNASVESRSLMALGTLAVVFAYFFRKNPLERLFIVASAIPIAILVNAFRVALTGHLAHRFGAGVADGVIHQTEGFFTFGLAFGLLLFEGWLLSMFWPRNWRRSPRRART